MEADDRAVILLNALGKDAREAVLNSLGPNSSDRVRARLERFQQEPPSDDDVNDVLDEFERCLRLANQYAPTGSTPDSEASDNRETRLSIHSAGDDETTHGSSTGDNAEREFKPTGDPLVDLNALDSQRIVASIQSEPPRMIAIILSCLDPRKAAEALCHIDGEVRSAVCLDLNKGAEAPRHLVEHIVKETIDGSRLEFTYQGFGTEYIMSTHHDCFDLGFLTNPF